NSSVVRSGARKSNCSSKYHLKVSDTRIQNSFGWPISASASASRCLARTCAGIGGGRTGVVFLLLQYRHATIARPTSRKTPAIHRTHIQSLGISTGGLISRRTFVPDTEAGAVKLLDTVSIVQVSPAICAFHAFQRICPAQPHMAGQCATGLRRFPRSETCGLNPRGLWSAGLQSPDDFEHCP